MPTFEFFSLPSSWHPEKNEDAFFIDEKNLTAGVFDGMGGHTAGDLASRLAAETIKSEISKLRGLKEEEIKEKIKQAFNLANQVIKLEAEKNPEYRSMGTTGSVIRIISDANKYESHTNDMNKFIVANVGDSRVYLKRKNQSLKQLTIDDSYVQQLVDSGQITKEEAEIHPLRNIITQSLGVGYQKPGIEVFKIDKGDIILICSDGVHDNLTDQEIKKELPDVKNLVKKAFQVSQQTTIRSKPDDITAVVIGI